MGGRHPYRACPKILHPHISCKIFTLLSFALSTGEHWGKGQKAVHRIKQGHTLLLNHSAKPCVKGLKITIKVKKKVTIAAVELHRSLLMTKRIASISPRAGWDPHPPQGQWCRYPAIPRDPLPFPGDSTGRSLLVMLLWQPGVISLLVMLWQSAATHWDAFMTSEAGRRVAQAPLPPPGAWLATGTCPQHPPLHHPHLTPFPLLFTTSFPQKWPWRSPSLRQAVIHTFWSVLGEGKHSVFLVKRAPCERVSQPTQRWLCQGLAQCISRCEPSSGSTAQHNRSNYLAEPPCAQLILHPQRLVVPEWSSRDWPHETLPEPRHPVPHTLGSTAVQNEHPEHYLGQICKC